MKRESALELDVAELCAIERWAMKPVPSSRRSQAVYLKHTCLDPISILGALAVLGVSIGSQHVLWAAGTIIGALILLFSASRLRWMRNRIDRRLERLQQIADKRVRAMLLRGMSDRHRVKLEAIEELIDEIRSSSTHIERAMSNLLESSIDLDLLASTYVRLAIQLQRNREMLAETDRDRIGMELHALEVDAKGWPESIRPALARRLALLKARALRWDQRREQAEIIEVHLQSLEDVVHLLYEVSGTSSVSELEQVDELLESLDGVCVTATQVAELAKTEASIPELKSGRSPPHAPGTRSHRTALPLLIR